MDYKDFNMFPDKRVNRWLYRKGAVRELSQTQTLQPLFSSDAVLSAYLPFVGMPIVLFEDRAYETKSRFDALRVRIMYSGLLSAMTVSPDGFVTFALDKAYSFAECGSLRDLRYPETFPRPFRSDRLYVRADSVASFYGQPTLPQNSGSDARSAAQTTIRTTEPLNTPQNG